MVFTITNVGAPSKSRANSRAVAMDATSSAAVASVSGRPASITFHPAALKRRGMSSVKHEEIDPSTVMELQS